MRNPNRSINLQGVNLLQPVELGLEMHGFMIQKKLYNQILYEVKSNVIVYN